MNWKKLSAFAPMLAVIVLAGCMGKTLAGYTPATYEAKAEEITLQEETTQSTEEKGQQTSKIKKKTKKQLKKLKFIACHRARQSRDTSKYYKMSKPLSTVKN